MSVDFDALKLGPHFALDHLAGFVGVAALGSAPADGFELETTIVGHEHRVIRRNSLQAPIRKDGRHFAAKRLGEGLTAADTIGQHNAATLDIGA